MPIQTSLQRTTSRVQQFLLSAVTHALRDTTEMPDPVVAVLDTDGDVVETVDLPRTRDAQVAALIDAAMNPAIGGLVSLIPALMPMPGKEALVHALYLQGVHVAEVPDLLEPVIVVLAETADGWYREIHLRGAAMRLHVAGEAFNAERPGAFQVAARHLRGLGGTMGSTGLAARRTPRARSPQQHRHRTRCGR